MMTQNFTPKPMSKRANPVCQIAVIGFSGRFPGGANSPEELWDFLKSGRDAVGELQGDRWDLSWHNPNPERLGRVYTKACGLLDQIDGFDADFFGISPREAKQLDPQQRLLLELAWEAFEDAGLPPRSMAGQNIGVYIGISSNDYAKLAGESWPDAYSNTGVSFSIAANRLSYVFDLHGPSLAIDTACSSSLVCVHQACQAIAKGECDGALAGGVSVLSEIRPWLGFSRASMLSPDGRCKSFDASGNGYVRSEGGGLVYLKRLEDAERDGDPILCVIRATGINSDGRTLGLAMPNGDAQAELLAQLYGAAGVDAEKVFYVEAHGTGTAVGDPIECGALGQILGAPRRDGSICHIGSVKSNIGHLEPASGIAGMAKVILALKHREIPAQLHFNTPNPKIDFDAWKLSVVTEPLPLPEHPVTIGVNSFGFGGTNAHAIIEEYRAPARPNTLAAPAHLILSGNTEAALRDMARKYAALLREPKADYAAIAHAAVSCRSLLRMRLAVAATTAQEAAEKLESWAEGTPLPGTASGTGESAHVPTAFVYSGNGPQWWGMGRALLDANPIFKKTLTDVDAIFAPLSGWSLLEEMTKPEEQSRIALTEVAQPMLFALQMGLTAVFRAAGITPAAVFGHSVGEVAAACASGALSLEQATQVIFHRSQEQARTAGTGKMLALGLDKEAAQKAIAQIGGWLEIAAINGPAAVTVAGDAALLQKLADNVSDAGKFARVLQLDYPFHTSAMDPIREALLAALEGLTPSAGHLPFISTVTGKTLSGQDLTANYWFDNVRQPVNFHGAVTHLLAEHGIGLFVEIGPHPVLKEYVAQTTRAAGASATVLETLRRPGKDGPESDANTCATAIAAALANGAIPLETLYQRPTTLPALPKYPWQRERHWRGAVFLPDSFIPTYRDHPLLGTRLPAVNASWEMPIDKNTLPYLADHVVQNSVLFPAAGYLELLLAGGVQTWGAERIIEVENLQILRPLVLGEQADPIVQTVIDARDTTVTISSRADRDARDFQVHVRARLSAIEDQAAPTRDLAQLRAQLPIRIDAAAHYAAATARGLQYGPFFQGLQDVHLSSPDAPTRAAFAKIQLDFNESSKLAAYRAHPALFDSCLQAIIPLVWQLDGRNISTIPVAFERVRSYANLPAELYCHVEITRESARSVVANFTLIAPDGKVVLYLEGGRCQKANLTGETLSPLTSEWWRPDTTVVRAHGLPALPQPEILLAPAPSDALRAMLDQIAGLYAARAIEALCPLDQNFTLAGIARAARLGRSEGAILQQALDIAAAAGVIREDGAGYIWAQETRPDVAALWKETFLKHPAHQAELLLLADRGESLPARLSGQDVPAPSAALLEQVQDSAPFAAPLNQLARAALDALVKSWPADRPMRILEIGGGTGGLASWLLPVLPAERADYLFTDPSETLVARAERRLAVHKFVRTACADPAQPLGVQGLPAGYFDLVIATGLGALQQSLAGALEHVQEVMAEGAKLIAPAPDTCAAARLMLGKPNALAPAALTSAGFEKVDTLAFAEATLLVATAPKARHSARIQSYDPVQPETFVIIAESATGFAESLAQDLGALGHSATVTPFPEQDKDSAIGVLRAVLDSTKAMRVVFLGDAQIGADLQQSQSRRALGAVALVGALELVRQERDCTLSIVTRGAFRRANGAGPIDPAEAALWGLGRVIGNEYSGLDLRMIDLCDSDDSALLAAELSRKDAETEVQLAGGHRYLNRERITTLADEARHAQLGAQSFALDFVPQAGLSSLYLRASDRKAPDQTEVEIAVKAAGLNFRDVLWCMGMLPEEAVEHGFSGATIGMECAGVVVSVGSGVSHLKKGDKVLAFASSCFGTHVTTDAKSVVKMPERMTFAEAATVPTVFLTAWYGLDYLARLEPGETILIHGAAGGVGLAAIQIAKQKGATVIGTAGSAMKRRMLEMVGVDHVLNSRSLDYADRVMDITKGAGVDVILNSLAGEAILKNLNILKPFGRFLEIGKRDLYDNSRIGLRPFRNNLSYFGIDADTLLIERPALAQRLFAEVIAQFAEGLLTPLPHQVIPISRAQEAFRTMQQSRHLGKLVISLELDRPEDLYVVPARNPIRAGGTYLVTGGLGGFGLVSAQWLVEQGATSLALVSRSGATRPEAQAALAEFAAAGIEVRAFAADIADRGQLDAVLQTIRDEMPPLIGVIHSAAVIEDAPVQKIEADQLARVYQPKMVGALNLHEATLDDALEVFVLYSSSATVVGNPGQGAYVAANLYLDALAQHRRAMGLPALAIGWGAIQDAGFLTRHENVRDMLKARSGLDATPAQAALADLGRALTAGASRVCVARFDLLRLQQLSPAARVPRFAPIVPHDAAALLQADETLADLLVDMPKSEQRGFVLDRIIETAARVMGTTAAQINPQQALGDLGLDSLMAVELANALERDVGQSIPVMQLLGAASLMAVADHVAKLLGVEIAGEGIDSTQDNAKETKDAA